MAIMVTTGMAIMAGGPMGTEEEGTMGAAAMEAAIMEDDTTAVAVVEDPTPVATVERDNTPVLDTVGVAEGSTLLLATAEAVEGSMRRHATAVAEDSTRLLATLGVAVGTGDARWLRGVVEGTVAGARWLLGAEADVVGRILASQSGSCERLPFTSNLQRSLLSG
jgi:hypothetical protein